MTIEQAIKQKKFSSPVQKVTVNILYTNNWLKEKHTSLLKSHGITDQHFNILRILRGQHPEPVSPGYIKQVLLDKRGDLTRLLDKLVKQELITREINQDCRRMININITKNGLSLLKIIDPEIQKVENRFKSMPQEELKQLSELLDKFRTVYVNEELKLKQYHNTNS